MTEVISPAADQIQSSEDPFEGLSGPSLPEFLPSPAELALRAAEIRSEWSLKQRARNRADPVKADVTDRLEGFQWPVEAAELGDGEDWADIDGNL